MKIVHVSTNEGLGGAGIAAARLHNELLNHSIESHLLVRWSSPGNGQNVTSVTDGSFVRKVYALIMEKMMRKWTQLFYQPRRPFSADLSFGSLRKSITGLAPDILHLHWGGKGLPVLDILEWWQGPMVWSMHDPWAFTGGCHVLYGCSKFMADCSDCPAVGSRIGKFAAQRALQRKVDIVARKRPAIICPSKWMLEQVRASQVFSKCPSTVVHNILGLNEFVPIPKSEARYQLGRSAKKIVITFGAVSALRDVRKGFAIYEQTLEFLRAKLGDENVEGFVFGNNERSLPSSSSITFWGPIQNTYKLNLIYSASDLVAVPSLEETFGQTALEGIASGVPIVGFKGTGLSEIVIPGRSGELANSLGDSLELGNLALKILQKSHCYTPRETFEALHNCKSKIDEFITLYAGLLDIAHKNALPANVSDCKSI